MSVFQHYRWFAAAAAITALQIAVSLTAHRGFGLTAFADIFVLAAMVLTGAVMLGNAVKLKTQRGFWGLMSFGFSLWAFNQGAWTYREVLLRQPLPDPYFADIILFFHLVPMISAVAWRPDIIKMESRFRLSTLNFLMLLVWWIFLYAFIVFPHQYVVLNVPAYDRYYSMLYDVENVLLIVVLGFAAWSSGGAWKRLYLNFFAAAIVYAGCSELLNQAVVDGRYYSGSLYDAPLLGAILWIAATVLTAREWNLSSQPPHPKRSWKKLTPVLAMAAILSLPLLGFWAFLLDNSAASSRTFRLFSVLGAMFILGAFVFMKQYIQDQALMHLLEESRNSIENQQRLQSDLVQKEKLASLGNLVSGAAHEINQPLTAIMEYSERLWSNERLTEQQNTLVRKIVSQAQRTRELVSGLLSFSQQSTGQKIPVDLKVLLQRGVQMIEAQHRSSKIKVSISIEPDFPRVRGNPNQLFQVFVEIIENAVHALEEKDGGSLEISARNLESEAVLHFSDSGPGVRDPKRVFDPFYTTKPIGKGTGLGLSAVYGVVQDHGGQITCYNKASGGAVFIVRFPLVSQSSGQAAAAAQS